MYVHTASLTYDAVFIQCFNNNNKYGNTVCTNMCMCRKENSKSILYVWYCITDYNSMMKIENKMKNQNEKQKKTFNEHSVRHQSVLNAHMRVVQSTKCHSTRSVQFTAYHLPPLTVVVVVVVVVRWWCESVEMKCIRQLDGNCVCPCKDAIKCHSPCAHFSDDVRLGQKVNVVH